MQKTFLTLILTLFAVLCNSQTFENYTKIEEYKGDLNRDGKTDKIIVYEKDCDTENPKIKCRRTAIFIAKNNGYELFAFNDNVIQCSDCGGAGVGDPFQDIVIKNGYFSIENLFGACHKTFEVITFKYDKEKNNFYLYKIGTEDYSCREEANLNGEIKSTQTIKTKNNFGVITFEEY